MPYEKIAPEWNAVGIEPPQSLKNNGWQFNQKPPADYFNWFFYNTAQAIIELQLEALNKDQKGATDGVAPLVGGKIPNTYLSIAAPADASLTTKGIVILDSSTASESETKAATPKAVKTVADSLASHTSNSNIHVTAQEKASYAAKETPTGAQTKADTAQNNAKAYTDQQVAAVSGGGVPALASYKYTLTAATEGQTAFTVPLTTFDPTTDFIQLIQNTTVLPPSSYLIAGRSITLSTGVTIGTQIYLTILKNVPAGPEGSTNGAIIAVNSMPVDRLQGFDAADVPILDAGNKYDATNVEGALQEAVTKINSAADEMKILYWMGAV